PCRLAEAERSAASDGGVDREVHVRRDVGAERPRRDPDPRRLRLPSRLPGRTGLAGREARLDRRRHVGDPEAHHQPPVAGVGAIAVHELLEPYAGYVGTWRGEGVGGYPSLDTDFRYGEEIVIA